MTKLSVVQLQSYPLSHGIHIYIPSPESISAAFPDHRSPCSRAGLTVTPVKKLGSLGSSCVHNSHGSPYTGREIQPNFYIVLTIIPSMYQDIHIIM